jgi:hypothetical protein
MVPYSGAGMRPFFSELMGLRAENAVKNPFRLSAAFFPAECEP